MHNKLFLRLGIYQFNDIDHAYITNKLGIQPSRIFIKGERRNPKFLPLAEDNGWCINADLYGEGSFLEQMNSLISLLNAHADVFEEFKEKYLLEISCVMRIDVDVAESKPWMNISKEMLYTLNKYHVEVDFDIYCVSDRK